MTAPRGAYETRAFTDFDSAVVFLDRHRKHLDGQYDGVIDTYTEYRVGSTPDSPASLVYSLSLVIPGHYAFERDGESLHDLWRQAGAYYATDHCIYNGGCDGSCLLQNAERSAP